MNQNNRLRFEKSPYLLQHQENPVNWFPWGAEAFDAAVRENKPIFLSIGYSTCYWCHVMEKDSFEREDVAEILNKSFIAIKVDREERPDVDSIYMDAVVALTGHGGWPMSVFLTPKLHPFFGGTYFPREQFKQLLSKINEIWQNQRSRVEASASEILSFLDSDSSVGNTEVMPSPEIFRLGIEQLSRRFDPEQGGFGGAPKFPPHQVLALLLRLARRSKDKLALAMLTTTLEKMAQGGIYDQIRGGFARYSVDERWLIPHFEKMLYDNAQLASVYLEAFQLTQTPFFATIARETLDYVIDEMTSATGAFYSAEDAGEVDKEGEYYAWTHEQLRSLLNSTEFELASTFWDLPVAGNFEHGRIVLSRNQRRLQSFSNEETETLLTSIKRKLLEARRQRTAPHKDDKILSSWNGLMISAMSDAYLALGNPQYLLAAQRAADFIEQTLMRDGAILRRFREGESAIPGMLEDYSFYIQGLLKLSEAELHPRRIELAMQLQLKQNELFWDSNEGGFFSTADSDRSLIRRKKEFEDNAVPSAQGVAAQNLFKLSLLSGEQRFYDQAKRLLQLLYSRIEEGRYSAYAAAYASFLQALDFYYGDPQLVVISGEKEDLKVKEILSWRARQYLPNCLMIWNPGPGKSSLVSLKGKDGGSDGVRFYVCTGKECLEPTSSVDKVIELLTPNRGRT